MENEVKLQVANAKKRQSVALEKEKEQEKYFEMNRGVSGGPERTESNARVR